MSTNQPDPASNKSGPDTSLIDGLKSELTRAQNFVASLSAAASSIQDAITLSKLHIDSSRALLQLPFLSEYSPPPDADSLTEREAQVLKFVAKGKTNKAIGHELGISMKTVEFHKSNAARKLGVSSRAEIVEYALVHGWLHNSRMS